VSFVSPLWLLALLALPAALLAQRVARRRAKRYALRFTAVASARAAAAGGGAWRARVPIAILLLAVAALAVALARPFTHRMVAVRQAEVVLVLDHSGSMQATDVKPTRLEAVVHAANSFLDQVPGSVRVGFVGFSSAPDTLVPLTADRGPVREALDAQVAQGSTDTGNALEDAISMLRTGKQPHGRAAIILLSDGAANAGPSPVAVAQQAARDDIVVDTVALGTPGGVLTSPFSPPIPVPPDPQLMHQIAEASHGSFFNVQDAGRLDSIYRSLGTRLSGKQVRRDVTGFFVAAGLALLLAALLAAQRWGMRLP
jgi:Ca-activated chloride channel family protein